MEEGTRKDRDFEEVIKASQPKFLEIVKETYYLAVLGSLCIAVSAFTQQNYPQAQAYAITGASLFLIAFFCSFIAKIIPSAFLIIPSYLSTGAGVLMLFLVTMEFGSAIPLVSKAFLLLYVGIFLSIMATIPYNLNRYRKTSKGKTKTCVTISVVFLTIAIPFTAITLIIPLVFDMASFGNIFLATSITFSACFHYWLSNHI